MQHLGGAIDRIFVIGHVLIAKPEREPAIPPAPGFSPESAGRARCAAPPAGASDSAELALPRAPGAQRVRGEIGAAAIERQRAPAAAKGGDAAVAILQTEQPAHAGETGGARFGLHAAEFQQGQKRARGIVGIRHPAGEIRPGPAAGRGVRVRMLAAILLAEQPLAQSQALLRGEQAGLRAERLDREGARPRWRDPCRWASSRPPARWHAKRSRRAGRSDAPQVPSRRDSW